MQQASEMGTKSGAALRDACPPSKSLVAAVAASQTPFLEGQEGS